MSRKSYATHFCIYFFRFLGRHHLQWCRGCAWFQRTHALKGCVWAFQAFTSGQRPPISHICRLRATGVCASSWCSGIATMQIHRWLYHIIPLGCCAPLLHQITYGMRYHSGRGHLVLVFFKELHNILWSSIVILPYNFGRTAAIVSHSSSWHGSMSLYIQLKA